MAIIDRRRNRHGAAGIEAVQRRHRNGRLYTFLANDTDAPVEVPVDGRILTGADPVVGGVRVPPHGLAVLRGS
ncbi:Beta-galactosidase C-terminal domain [Plantactinospora sp. S1510]|uniref:Beta-galactosidase C-terminal domain n=1 Tax=Plantactinospora alkalitolerans TaxID=2789879 RepID=A0ABS0GY01_9ACTN|nr:Beta-galactosidase C-terminal domain [Plantactinospora alkalitolerans]MBF9131083.1 Beta-galactosidase C-terminal domain [Plantactinospora alkalitolerans]